MIAFMTLYHGYFVLILIEQPAHWQMLCKIGTTDEPFSSFL